MYAAAQNKQTLLQVCCILVQRNTIALGASNPGDPVHRLLLLLRLTAICCGACPMLCLNCLIRWYFDQCMTSDLWKRSTSWWRLACHRSKRAAIDRMASQMHDWTFHRSITALKEGACMLPYRSTSVICQQVTNLLRFPPRAAHCTTTGDNVPRGCTPLMHCCYALAQPSVQVTPKAF